MLTGPNQKPPDSSFGEWTHRGLDPWHTDAFPLEFKHCAPHHDALRGSGWFLADAWGNEIGFCLDGTYYE